MKNWIENIIIVAGIAFFLLPIYKLITAFSFDRLIGSILVYALFIGVFFEIKKHIIQK